MKNKRELIRKVLNGVIPLCLLFASLNSCSKKDENNVNEKKILTVDLTKPKYSALNQLNGYFVFDTLGGVIVGNNTAEPGNPYLAAKSICPACSSPIAYLPYPQPNPWKCSGCNSEWNAYGALRVGTSAYPLKIYKVTKTGNILTVTIN